MAANMMDVVALDPTRAWSATGRGGPLAVEVLEGTVLLTVEGDPRDRVLSAGELFQGPAERRVAATGLSPSRIRVISRVAPPPFARLAVRDGRQLARHLLGGALIIAVWLSLWTWVAVGVVRPLSAVPQADVTEASSDAS